MSQQTPMKLVWGLAIATYQRAGVLCQTVEYALRQTRPPVDVVIVDSSADWQTTRDRIANLIQQIAPHVRLSYQFSGIAQQTAQRNQALDCATADILFMIDDDAFLRCDAAEHVMRVYEADLDGQTIAVGPGPMSLWKGFDIIDDTLAVSARPPTFFKGLVSKVLAMGFFACDLRGKPAPLPPVDLPLKATIFIDGYRLTVRRAALKQFRFDENLISNRFEDADAVYRLAQQGGVVTIQKPLIYHAASTSARGERQGVLSRFGWILNIAYLNRKFCGEGPYVRLICWTHWLRNIIPDLLSGLLRRDLSRFRGCIYATVPLLKMTFTPQSQLAEFVRREGIAFRNRMRYG
jgi:GT2 family glycosyltransferase